MTRSKNPAPDHYRSISPHTQVVYGDEAGSEFAVSVFGALSHDEALAEGERHLREFIELRAWTPVGAPVYRRMQDGSAR